jgi:hypothetical protein
MVWIYPPISRVPVVKKTVGVWSGAGLTVAVVEEVNEIDGLNTKAKIKARVLSQVSRRQRARPGPGLEWEGRRLDVAW